MFPQIAKKKKKDFVVDEALTKQWEEALRDLQIKSKITLKRIPHSILQDFGKVCRIKSIPEFYANYFICSTHKLEGEHLSQAYAEEIQRLLTCTSHFHRINQALRQREELIEGLKNSLIIVEGFLLMNQNKIVPLQIKSSIDGLVNDCATLDELKDLERKKTEELAKDVIRVRTNTTQLIELVDEWRVDLDKLSKNQGSKRGRMIYPHQAINCLLMPLYDLLFLRNSALRGELSFGKDQHDPFLERLTKSKKGSQIQNYLIDYLKADTTDYSQFLKMILEELPSQQAERLREKELQLEQKRQQKAKQQKMKEEKLLALRQERQKDVRIRNYSSVRTLKSTQKEEIPRNLNSKTSKGERSEKKIINVDKILRSKSIKNRKQEQDRAKESKLNDNESKVLGAYKQKSKKNPMDQSLTSDRGEILQEKKIWEKQIKEEKEEKEKIRRLLKQSEKKAMQETRQFEEKLKRYEDEVQNLKSRVEQSKKVRITSSNEKPKGTVSPEKAKKIVASAYKSQIKPKDSGTSMLQSKLQEESKVKRNLEKQIKELAKQKIKLQKLIQRQNLKATKDVQLNKKQIEKYEQVIDKLKSQTEQSRKIIHELQTSKVTEQRKQAELMRSSIIKQKQGELKRNIQERIEERQKRKKIHEIIKIDQILKNHSKKKSLKDINQISQSIVASNKSTSQVRVDDSQLQILKSKLEEQSKSKKSLESQIRDLAQQKLKLQKFIERQSHKTNKEGDKNSKRIEKYEETINRLQRETEDSRKVIAQLQSSKVTQDKKHLERSRIESVRKRQELLKQKIQQKIEERERRKKLQKEKLEKSKRSNEKRLSNSKNIESTVKGFEDVEIIKTKQTIEIVFEPKKRREGREGRSKELLEAESKLVRLEKERDLLERKLQISMTDKKEKAAHVNNKISQRTEIASKFQDQIEREREKNTRLQDNIKKMRKNISNEFELKLNKQKVKYEKEREELIKMIEKQRQEKRSKDKVLEQQMTFLREMEKKENELFELLEKEKKEKLKKEQILTRELEKKEELMSILQIEQIKKGIEREVRKELEENESDEEVDVEHQQRKMELEQEIEQLRMEKENELEEMNDQNEKLRELIAQIKVEETHLLEAIKQNIEMDSETERQGETDREDASAAVPVLSKQDQQVLQLQNLQKQNQQLTIELQSKTANQFRSEERKKQNYALIAGSENYRDKEKIQNLVELYLQSPHQYPGEKSPKIEEAEKKQFVRDGSEKARQIEKFQTELFSLRDMPEFVPSMKNNSITNHLLNLRQAYEDYEADALRRQLFPPLESEVYGQRELSYESEQPPMNTLRDQVKDHLRKHPKQSDKGGKKNFLAINRVRLAVLEDGRKEKQRIIIEEESRKKIQKELFDKRRKVREDHVDKQRERQQEIKLKKLEQIYNKEKTISLKELAAEEDRRKSKEKQKSNDKAARSGSSREARKGKRKSISKQPQMLVSKQPQSESDLDGQKSDNEVQKAPVPQVAMTAIKEEQVQHSLQQKQADIVEQVQQYEQQLKKRERDLLKQQIKLVQQEVRSYINQEQRFQIYQQFVNDSELLIKIQQLLDLSSSEIKNLNGNTTLKDDVQSCSSLALLVAKDSKGIQIGLAVFHKQFSDGAYICDYLIAHNMENFLTLAFNFSRFLFQNDLYAHKIEFLFNLKTVVEPNTLRHFLEFQKKCRRLGEVYIKAKSENERKYVLRRTLFETSQEKSLPEIGGIGFNLSMCFCGQMLEQINQGFSNESDPNFSSYNIILAYYLSKKEKKLARFRQRAESELIYRQLLVTSLLFQKKELEIKNFSIVEHESNYSQPLAFAKNKFDLQEISQLEEMKMSLTEKLPQLAKRCTLQVGFEQINYLMLAPEEATTSIQSSNSSQTGYFLSLVPKYKLMIIEAQEFLTMSSKNIDLTAFFYIKHFIKNIVDVKKEKYERLYLPEVHVNNQLHLQPISQKLKETVLFTEGMEIGWRSRFPNSVLYTPRHQDLVIQRPFIVALLSANVERAVQGSPICVQVVI